MTSVFLVSLHFLCPKKAPFNW